jgi:hypothetical protein
VIKIQTADDASSPQPDSPRIQITASAEQQLTNQFRTDFASRTLAEGEALNRQVTTNQLNATASSVDDLTLTIIQVVQDGDRL